MPWATLGDLPTPIDELSIAGAPLWVKREGDSSARYGGNKVRTLEAWLGHARASGARRIWAIGAYGSNHVVATVLHAHAIGLESGALVFPQPASEWAVENAGALIASGVPIVRLRNVVEVPFAGVAIAAQARLARLIRSRLGEDRASTSRYDEEPAPPAHDIDASPLTQVAGDHLVTPPRRTIAELARDAMTGAPASRALGMLVGRELARDSIVMPPGGATPIGTLGALSAVFELAEQIADGVAPPPRRIVLPVGSTCTTAGLLSGFAIAQAMGAWRWPVPIVHAVRVTPWPVTSRIVIVRLAEATLARIALLGGPRVQLGAPPRLIVDPSELGGGYGRVTDHGVAAMRELGAITHAPRLDGVYSAKAAAALLRLHGRGIGPLLFWATKATTVMAAPGVQALRAAPRPLVQWLR